MAIYVNYDGIPGEATEGGHEKWIQVDSVQWGVGRSIHTGHGHAANRESSEANVSEVVFTKHMDASSPKIFTESVIGKGGKTVKIDFVTTSGETETYLQYTLTHALVSGYSVSSGGDRPSESVSLNFTKIEMKLITHDQTGKANAPVTVGFDMAKNKAS